MTSTSLLRLRDLEYAQLQKAYYSVTREIAAKRLRGQSTRALEKAARNMSAMLNDRYMAGVSNPRALMVAAVPRR